MGRKFAAKSAPATPVAFIYRRVSTARQAEEGIGLDAQDSKCRAHAERLGWSVGGVYTDEGISGKDGLENRPGLVALIEAAQKTPGAIVVVYSVSRLARRQRLLWNLLDEREGYGLAVSSATEAFDTSTPTGRAMLGMIAVFAALESDMVSERTRDALAELKAQGRKLGAPSMVDLNADAVRRVRELYATGGFTHRTLAQELNRLDVPTATGKGQWWPKTVRTALLAGETA